jgi:hypothetical protein
MIAKVYALKEVIKILAGMSGLFLAELRTYTTSDSHS